MSEGWGGDAIPGSGMGRGSVVAALSSGRHLPAEALDEACRRPKLVADAVLAVANRAASGETLEERERNLLFWGSHALAQAGDTRLFGPLLGLLRRPGQESAEHFLEVVDTTLPRILIATFDGDAEALEAGIADPEADEALRWSLFAAFAALAGEGRIGRDRAHAFLVRFDDQRLARAGDAAWAGWEEAIALLGFRDLADRRAAAVADARLLADEGEADGFGPMLLRAEAEGDDLSRFAEQGLGPVMDAVAELDEALAEDGEAEPEEPTTNPLRHVGRNDPCPCGSGRKYKKCCLAA